MMSFIPDISPSKDGPDQKGIATHRTDVVSDGFFNVFCLLVTKK